MASRKTTKTINQCWVHKKAFKESKLFGCDRRWLYRARRLRRTCFGAPAASPSLPDLTTRHSARDHKTHANSTYIESAEIRTRFPCLKSRCSVLSVRTCKCWRPWFWRALSVASEASSERLWKRSGRPQKSTLEDRTNCRFRRTGGRRYRRWVESRFYIRQGWVLHEFLASTNESWSFLSFCDIHDFYPFQDGFGLNVFKSVL